MPVVHNRRFRTAAPSNGPRLRFDNIKACRCAVVFKAHPCAKRRDDERYVPENWFSRVFIPSFYREVGVKTSVPLHPSCNSVATFICVLQRFGSVEYPMKHDFLSTAHAASQPLVQMVDRDPVHGSTTKRRQLPLLTSRHRTAMATRLCARDASSRDYFIVRHRLNSNSRWNKSAPNIEHTNQTRGGSIRMIAAVINHLAIILSALIWLCTQENLPDEKQTFAYVLIACSSATLESWCPRHRGNQTMTTDGYGGRFFFFTTVSYIVALNEPD